MLKQLKRGEMKLEKGLKHSPVKMKMISTEGSTCEIEVKKKPVDIACEEIQKDIRNLLNESIIQDNSMKV
jgi:hypothetical protein